MKEKLLFIIIGACLTLLIAATTTDTVTVIKPAKPTQTKADWFALTTSAISYIEQNTKEGWQVKSVTPNSQKSEYLVILEKY